MAESANELIKQLLEQFENTDDQTYYSSDTVAQADDWLKWYNEEVANREAKKICLELTNKSFLSLTD